MYKYMSYIDKRNGKKKDEGLIQKLLNIKNSRKLDFLLRRNSDEYKELQKIKKEIRKIKTIEELDALEDKLAEMDIIDRAEFERLKKKKKDKYAKASMEFQDRVRCDLDIINKVILVGKNYQERARQIEEKEMLQYKDERLKNGGVKDKDKDELTRSSSGRGKDRGRDRGSR